MTSRYGVLGLTVTVTIAAACGGSDATSGLFDASAGGSSNQGGSTSTGGSVSAGGSISAGGASSVGGNGAGAMGGSAGGTTAKGGSGGSGTAGSNAGKGGSGTAGTGQGGSGTAGTGQGGSGTAGIGQGGSGTAGTGQGGSGTAGAPTCADCSSLSTACSMGVCSAGKCVAEPRAKGTVCSDGNACTGGDVCDGNGQCKSSTTISCTPATQCHTATCDPQTGSCTQANAANGTSCDDGNPATTGDMCTSGVCMGKGPVDDFRPRLIEVSTDAADYVIIRNEGTTAGNLGAYHLGFSSASNVPANYLDGYEFTMPSRTLQPQEQVILVEPEGMPKTGEIALTNNVWWWWGGAGVWLCKGPCGTASVVDAFWFGLLKVQPPTGLTFTPSIPGNQTGQAPHPTFLRKTFVGTPPAFLSTDWAQGQPTR